MLGSTADTSSCVRLRWLVLLVTFHLAQCSLPHGQAHEAWHHGLYAQKDSYELGSGMSRAGSAGGHASRVVLAEMRGSLFGALCIGTGPGVVSTGTRPP